mmetsp:Transcript_34226/g.33468  ORF Transcript_34226/g.33468 Transcript_34226/m.33468 type:complete len:303 (-) Transcript_34226:150-1058(-)
MELALAVSFLDGVEVIELFGLHVLVGLVPLHLDQLLLLHQLLQVLIVLHSLIRPMLIAGLDLGFLLDVLFAVGVQRDLHHFLVSFLHHRHLLLLLLWSLLIYVLRDEDVLAALLVELVDLRLFLGFSPLKGDFLAPPQRAIQSSLRGVAGIDLSLHFVVEDGDEEEDVDGEEDDGHDEEALVVFEAEAVVRADVLELRREGQLAELPELAARQVQLRHRPRVPRRRRIAKRLILHSIFQGGVEDVEPVVLEDAGGGVPSGPPRLVVHQRELRVHVDQVPGERQRVLLHLLRQTLALYHVLGG